MGTTEDDLAAAVARVRFHVAAARTMGAKTIDLRPPNTGPMIDDLEMLINALEGFPTFRDHGARIGLPDGTEREIASGSATMREDGTVELLDGSVVRWSVGKPQPDRLPAGWVRIGEGHARPVAYEIEWGQTKPERAGYWRPIYL